MKRGVRKIQLVLCRLSCLSNSLLPCQIVRQFAEARGIPRACHAVLCRLLQRIERVRQRALRLPGNRRLVRRTQPGVTQYALELGHQRAAESAHRKIRQ